MNEAVPAVEHISPGKALAAARAELKLSVADVSQQIKYGVKQVAAIEADDYEKLPGMTFVRGMIRSYAKLVQIDAEPLLVDLGGRGMTRPGAVDFRISGQEPFLEGREESNRVYVLLSVAALLAVAVVAYQWWMNPLDTGVVVTITPKAAQGDAGTSTLLPSASPVSDKVPELSATAPAATAPAVTAPLVPAPASVPESEGVKGALAGQQGVQTTTEGLDKARVSGLKRIELEFDQLSWVEVKEADNKVVLSQLNRAGTKQVIDGVPPFQVVIGNAAGVRLKYNDLPVDLRPFFKVNVARLKLE